MPLVRVTMLAAMHLCHYTFSGCFSKQDVTAGHKVSCILPLTTMFTPKFRLHNSLRSVRPHSIANSWKLREKTLNNAG